MQMQNAIEKKHFSKIDHGIQLARQSRHFSFSLNRFFLIIISQFCWISRESYIDESYSSTHAESEKMKSIRRRQIKNGHNTVRGIVDL